MEKKYISDCGNLVRERKEKRAHVHTRVINDKKLFHIDLHMHEMHPE